MLCYAYNLQFNGLSVEFYGPDFLQDKELMSQAQRIFTTFWLAYEIYSDRADIALCICVIGKSQQKTGLSNARVSNEQQFEEIVTGEKVIIGQLSLSYYI